MARVGHKVLALERVAFGPLKLGSLPPGRHRELSSFEIRQLRQFIAHGEASESDPHRAGSKQKFGYRTGQTRGDRKRPTTGEAKSATPVAGTQPDKTPVAKTPAGRIPALRTSVARPTSKPGSSRPQPSGKPGLKSKASGSGTRKPAKRKPVSGATTERPVRPINKGRDRRRDR